MTEQQPPFFSHQGDGQGAANHQPSSQESALKGKKGYLGALLGISAATLVLGVLLGSFAAYFFGKNQFLSENSTTIKRLAKAQKGAKEYSQSLVKESDYKADYRWNFKNLSDLTFTNDKQKGLTADQLVETFGLASRAELKEDGLELSWGQTSAGSNQSLTFSFAMIEDNYYLERVSIDSPLPDYLDEVDNPEEARRTMSREYFNSLKSGNSETGQGGTNLMAVIQKYPQPSNFRIGSELEAEYGVEKKGQYRSERVVAILSYNVGDDYERLTFVRQKDGSFAYVKTETDD